MKSTKYQLLQADFDHACKELRQYREVIEQQRKEIEHLKFVMRKYDKYANWSYAKKYEIEL